MNIGVARAILGIQDKNLRKLRDTRFTYKDKEFRVSYQGGFSAFTEIKYRPVGKRNFLHYGGFGAYDCTTAQEALSKAIDIIKEVEGE